MLKFLQYNKSMRVKDSDYYLYSLEDLTSLLPYLVPKFEGKWILSVIEPKIVEAKEIIDEELIPEEVECYVYLTKKKLSNILLDYPQFTEKEVTVKDAYLEMVRNMKHPFDKKALWYVYNAVGRNLQELESALTELDNNCTGDTITITEVQKQFNYTKRIYTNQVLREFLMHSRGRWNHFYTWLNDLGTQYAYNSIRKQIGILLKEKNAYLHNENIKSFDITKVDGVSICAVYSLFANSTSHYQLEAIMRQIDHLSEKSYKEYINNIFER